MAGIRAAWAAIGLRRIRFDDQFLAEVLEKREGGEIFVRMRH